MAGPHAAVLDRVSLVLGGRVVLRDVRLAPRGAEFVAMLSPHGAGKTTLVGALLGLVPVLSGRLDVPGRRTARQPEIGYVPRSRTQPWDEPPMSSDRARWRG